MTLKLLTPTEIKTANEAERVKDISRIESARNALKKVQQQLNETEAKFQLSLAGQQKRWAKEEEEATIRLNNLQTEMKVLEKQREELLVPIEDEKKKAHDLFIEADKIFNEAHRKLNDAHILKEDYEYKLELLQTRLDELSEQDQKLTLREKTVTIREEAVIAERAQIKKLSEELTIKLTKL